MESQKTRWRMQAEWEKQEAVWLGWPHNRGDWPDRFAPIPWVYIEMMRYLTQVVRVRLVVRDERARVQAKEYCRRDGVNLDRVDFYLIPTNRVWLRDCGPIFVKEVPSSEFRVPSQERHLPRNSQLATRNSKAMLDWRFNAWAKYPNHKLDDRVPELVNKRLKLARIQPMHNGRRVVLEGGAIDVNGKGTLLTTEECLLSSVQCRNPGFTRDDYEAVFARYLGVKQVIWLNKGIAGDDTHGHVDDLARFVNPATVVVASEKDKRDDNFTLLQENFRRLKQATDQSGKPLTVVELPMPRPLVFDGQRLPASYANFLITNKLVLVPTFNDPADRTALAILAELFPKHNVVGIHCVDFVWGLGTIHCASQQEPA
jgi:agmatine deiminase